jgi:hypothetical protein
MIARAPREGEKGKGGEEVRLVRAARGTEIEGFLLRK